MEKFIYVFSETDRDKLLELNYQLMKSDETQSLYIFLNKDRLDFSIDAEMSDMTYVRTDTLTF